jgi:hypothetical protein
MAVQQIPSPLVDQSPFFEASVDQSGVGNSDIIKIRAGGLRTSVGFQLELVNGTGTAKIQFTCGKRDEIDKGEGVGKYIWSDWEDGAVSSTNVGQFGPISGIRIVVTSGTGLWRLHCQMN